nr:sulfatase-like hydrolase/transferase [Spirochaeta sp.]
MQIPRKILPAVLLCLSLSSYLYANPYPVYFAGVIQDEGKEILHFEWRPDYKSYDRAVITDQKGDLVAELSYPLNSLDITQLRGHGTLFITAVDTNEEKSETVKVDLRKDYSSLLANGPAEKIIIKKQRGRPNIILLFIDDLGYGDTGPFGCTDIPTPNIDRLAEEGTTFTQFYVTNPPCCPSRSSMMMGMYGQSFGKYGMSRGLPIPEDKPTLAEFIRDAGYVTGQIGKWDLGSKIQGPSSRGFMEVAENLPAFTRFQYKTIEGDTAWLTEANGDQMIEFVDRNREKPFFLYWSPLAVHSPSDNVPDRLAARTSASEKRRKLGGAIVSMDDQVGKLLSFLDKHMLRENTLVIFTSDNGPNLAEGGTSAPYRGGKFEGTQQIGWTISPTIMSWPGVIPQGKRFDGLSCSLDFYATIASAAGIAAPEHIQGVDVIPYLIGEKQGDPHEYLFWLNNDPNDPPNRHLVAVRWKQWRLYRKYEEDAWQLFDL